MKTTITFRHIPSSDAVKNFVHQRLEKLAKYSTKETEAHVILSIEKHLHNAEIVLHTKGVRATGKGSTNDMYASIETATDKVEKAMRRHHDKKTRSKSAPAREAASAS